MNSHVHEVNYKKFLENIGEIQNVSTHQIFEDLRLFLHALVQRLRTNVDTDKAIGDLEYLISIVIRVLDKRKNIQLKDLDKLLDDFKVFLKLSRRLKRASHLSNLGQWLQDKRATISNSRDFECVDGHSDVDYGTYNVKSDGEISNKWSNLKENDSGVSGNSHDSDVEVIKVVAGEMGSNDGE